MRKLIIACGLVACVWGCTEEILTLPAPPEPGPVPKVVATSDSVWVVGKSIFAALSIDKNAADVILVGVVPFRDSFPLFHFSTLDSFDYWQNRDQSQPTLAEIRYRNSVSGLLDTLVKVVGR